VNVLVTIPTESSKETLFLLNTWGRMIFELPQTEIQAVYYQKENFRLALMTFLQLDLLYGILFWQIACLM